MKVGIQGVRASFHDVAARIAYPDRSFDVVEHSSFPLLASALERGDTDRALMAIENSIAGSILPNYGLLERHGLRIEGEIYLRIEHQLMALPGQTLADIVEVKSHPMALAQCETFLLEQTQMRRLEGEDTAASAKEIAEGGLRGRGAIASRLAAETYGLEILAAGIETDRRNYTRFLVVCRGADHRSAEGARKASLRFEAAHRPGSLARILEAFAGQGVNLTKIQSVPIPGRPYQYSFHVDLEWEDSGNCSEALRRVSAEATNLIHFGEYRRGERPVET